MVNIAGMLIYGAWGSWCLCKTHSHNFFFFEREVRQAIAKAREAVDHLASFLSSKEEISQLGIEPPTSFLRFGILITLHNFSDVFHGAMYHMSISPLSFQGTSFMLSNQVVFGPLSIPDPIDLVV